MYDSLDYIILIRKDWRYPALIDIFSNNWRSWKKNFNELELDPASFSSCKSLLVRSLSEKPFFLQGPFSEAFFSRPLLRSLFSRPFLRSLSFKDPSTKCFKTAFCKDKWLWTLPTEFLTEPWTQLMPLFDAPSFWRLQCSTKDPFCWLTSGWDLRRITHPKKLFPP